MATAVLEDPRSKPKCDCCDGSGTHAYRPYVSPSPDDDDIECSACGGEGESWFDNRRNSCSGYRELMRSHR
jgi:DnaJ-class molecular chaperone